ncbi:MAG: pyruvate ferredoxin oxidoreductase [Candidatus Stahlbacteria bacterium]|jgi:pyruvate/2-oxoacid:ferredoxin oxidoreductase alpha subunit|nr:pyruvate ferredoxin oxidoreductase [candidate division WOR-3 bacterium]TET98542.1 MAG: pyruvate ferredoxin oxidoreductase [Candidatus Stahlbacteria bacterium]
MRKVIIGNHALSYGAMLSRAQVIAAYPITPQTEVIELLSEMCANGELDAKFIKVESEHSAMTACVGASATGVRTFTATSAQGLALMHEVLHWAVGARTPVVMGNINRAMAPPWTIWTEQTDSLSQRDTGWMQIYCQNNQEVLDSVIQAYKVAEQVKLPAMVILAAFVLSHTSETVEMPEQEKVDEFLPPYELEYKIDPDDPHAFGGLTGPDGYFELRYIIQKAIEDAIPKWEEVGEEFGKLFGRSYGLVETYKIEDAKELIISSATVASTARSAIDYLREKGKKVGLLRIRVFRPFPAEKVKSLLSAIDKAIVIDRNISFGASGIFYQEVKAACYNEKNKPPIFGVITGLGGRDVGKKDIIDIYEYVMKQDKVESDIIWKGVRV